MQQYHLYKDFIHEDFLQYGIELCSMSTCYADTLLYIDFYFTRVISWKMVKVTIKDALKQNLF